MIATTAPQWGHNHPDAVAARLTEHLDALLASPEARGFPPSRPRRCASNAARVAKARELLEGETVLEATDREHFRRRVGLLEMRMVES